MNKKYKLAVSNTVVVSVKANISDADGKPKEHKFSVTCNRLGQDELTAAFAVDSPYDFLLRETTAWARQKLVLEADGTPAEFSTEALEALLDIQGMTMVIFTAYMKEAAATVKN